MLDYVKRRKRLFIAGAAGIAGAAAAYYWLSREDKDQEDSHSREPAPIGFPSLDRNEPVTLDESLSQHFEYIQGVSTPQEYVRLAPVLQQQLYEATDVPTALAALPPGTPAAVKLRVLAQHSLSRGLAAVWVIPMLDLLIRAKLTIIGRHMLLQEKLLKLKMGQHFQEEMQGSNQHRHNPEVLSLSAEMIQALVPCDYFINAGSKWIIQQVLDVVGQSLEDISLDIERGPQELAGLLKQLHSNVQDALWQLEPATWLCVLLGEVPFAFTNGGQWTSPPGLYTINPTLGPYDAPPRNAFQDLMLELCGTLSSPQWRQSLQSTTQYAFHRFSACVMKGYPPAPVAEASASATNTAPTMQAGETTARTMQQSETPALHRTSDTDAESSSFSIEHVSVNDVTQDAARNDGASLQAAQQPPRSWVGFFNQLFKDAQTGFSSMFVLPKATVESQQQQQEEQLDVSSIRSDSASRQAEAETATAAAEKPPRPTARLLRPVQLATDPLFENHLGVSRKLGELRHVQAWTASTYARPLTYPDAASLLR